MKVKQIISLCVVVLGVALIGYGMYSKHQVSTARAEIHKMAQSSNPVVKNVGQEMESMIGGYRSLITWSFFGGGILVIIGAAGLVFFRKHR